MKINNRRNKYNAAKTKVDGITFDSKAEAKRYSELKIMQKSKEIDYFLCQVPFRLSGGIIYRVDFLIKHQCYYCAFCKKLRGSFVPAGDYFKIKNIFNEEKCICNIGNDNVFTNNIRYEDVKGVLTDVSRIKIKQVQEIYGITINLITKKGVVTI